jgi:hypothetical protein
MLLVIRISLPPSQPCALYVPASRAGVHSVRCVAQSFPTSRGLNSPESRGVRVQPASLDRTRGTSRFIRAAGQNCARFSVDVAYTGIRRCVLHPIHAGARTHTHTNVHMSMRAHNCVQVCVCAHVCLCVYVWGPVCLWVADQVYLAISDTSNMDGVAGWPLRNVLLMAAVRWGCKQIQVQQHALPQSHTPLTCTLSLSLFFAWTVSAGGPCLDSQCRRSMPGQSVQAVHAYGDLGSKRKPVHTWKAGKFIVLSGKRRRCQEQQLSAHTTSLYERTLQACMSEDGWLVGVHTLPASASGQIAYMSGHCVVVLQPTPVQLFANKALPCVPALQVVCCRELKGRSDPQRSQLLRIGLPDIPDNWCAGDTGRTYCSPALGWHKDHDRLLPWTHACMRFHAMVCMRKPAR